MLARSRRFTTLTCSYFPASFRICRIWWILLNTKNWWHCHHWDRKSARAMLRGKCRRIQGRWLNTPKSTTYRYGWWKLMQYCTGKITCAMRCLWEELNIPWKRAFCTWKYEDGCRSDNNDITILLTLLTYRIIDLFQPCYLVIPSLRHPGQLLVWLH